MAIFSKKKTEKVREEKNSIPSITERLAWKTIVKPHISEKATDLEKENRYVFEVTENANKIEVKKAIKELYGVNPLSVNIIKLPKKKKRLGRYTGWKKGFKKAVVQLKKGERIDLMTK
ncbi:MAG: 50S ribosomal protein L23 [Minisyncoccales bacterium]|jgi:large subunit ribosomal protein L23